MAARKKKRKPKKTYRFQLTLSGIVGIGVVSFCLFLWMFLLGIWAGQTILLPSARPQVSQQEGSAMNSSGKNTPVATLVPGAKKKPAESARRR